MEPLIAQNEDTLAPLVRDIDALRSPEGYLNAGIPNYNHLFGRDACVSALQLLEYDPSIARVTLRVMARYQAKKHGLMNEAYPGKMPHEHYPGGVKQIISSIRTAADIPRKLYILLFWRFPYYGTVDAGAWFIILLHRYVIKTGDETLLRELWPSALGVISWLEARAANRPSGLVAYRRRYVFGLLNQSWKDTLGSSLKPPTAMIEVQGYYYHAYMCMAELALERLGDVAKSKHFTERAEALKKSANDIMWHPETGYFSMAVNDRGEHESTITSNPGHLLFTGMISPEQAQHIVEHMMQPDMLTPYGVRTLSSNEKTFSPNSYQQGSVWPFDNWVFYQGLLKLGYADEAAKIKSALLAAHQEFDAIPELYRVSRDNQLSTSPDACTVQAWSAGALINMVTCQNPVL